MKRPRDLADSIKARRDRDVDRGGDGFRRETFTLPLDAARTKAREILDRFPAGGYATIVEHWQRLPDGRITFTIRRLPTAD